MICLGAKGKAARPVSFPRSLFPSTETPFEAAPPSRARPPESLFACRACLDSTVQLSWYPNLGPWVGVEDTVGLPSRRAQLHAPGTRGRPCPAEPTRARPLRGFRDREEPRAPLGCSWRGGSAGRGTGTPLCLPRPGCAGCTEPGWLARPLGSRPPSPRPGLGPARCGAAPTTRRRRRGVFPEVVRAATQRCFTDLAAPPVCGRRRLRGASGGQASPGAPPALQGAQGAGLAARGVPL